MDTIKIERPVGKFESRSRPGNFYTVLARLDYDFKAYFTCNCPRWTTSKQNRGLDSCERTCSHCEKVGIDFPEAVKDAIRRFELFEQNEDRTVRWWQGGVRVTSPTLNARKGTKPNLVFAPAEITKADSPRKQVKADQQAPKRDRLDYLEL